ncbi:MAG: hypothetical protein L6427_06775 [Actinomycetia bacterium]|nr:hypothetical protein [Actinomycetes bacterium]
MPVCLKCGKSIDPDRHYCEECGLVGKAQVERMFQVVEGSPYKKKRTASYRWIVAVMLGFTASLAVVAYAIFSMMPSGPEFVNKAQAGICRGNLSRIEVEVERYYEVEGEYPPAGRIDENHPLVVDRYLDEPSICPATDHYYVLEKDGPVFVVTCDSGEKGHDI